MNDSRSNPEFDSIFDACLRDVLRGTVTIDQCLEQYPQYADELKPALQAGILTTRMKSPEMSAASIDWLEMRLRGQMAATVTSPKRTFTLLPLSRAAAGIAIVFLFALGSGAGAVAASANSVPGDWLYGLKRLWEAIVLALTPLTGEVDDLWLQIAERRLDEVETLNARGALSQAALLDLYEASARAVSSADENTTPEVTSFLSRMQTSIQIMPDAAGLKTDLLLITTPMIGGDGRLLAPSLTPPSLNATTVRVTATPTPTVTPSPTASSTPTVTVSPSPSATSAATSTPTPRVPATATRTQTPTVTPTVSSTPLPSPTATWTPLPLPTLPQQEPVVTATNRPGSDPSGSGTSPDPQATIRYRETEQSVYLTQTAGPPVTEASSE